MVSMMLELTHYSLPIAPPLTQSDGSTSQYNPAVTYDSPHSLGQNKMEVSHLIKTKD